MSSAFSHLPDEFPAQRIVGLGLSGAELQANPAPNEYVVYDLNTKPVLPFTDAEFAAVVLHLSVQYLTKPIAIFREVGRILQPGGPFIVIFCNRMFPTKAIAIWRMNPDEGHAELVERYFQMVGGYEEITYLDCTPAMERYADPVYVVMATNGQR